MSEFGAIRNAVRAERQLIQAEKVTAKAATQTTKTGKVVDISKGFNVRAPDGTVIPFRPDTPLEKAKEWTKNFYAPNSDFEITEGVNVQLPDQPKVQHFTLQRKDAEGMEGLAFEQSEDGTYQVRMSQLNPKKKGAGIGAGMYRQLFEKAKKDGMLVKSDSSMTEDSIAIWRRFKELGYPVKEYPLQKTGKTFMGKPQYVRAGSKPEQDLPLFEFDPALGASIKQQAGQTAADKAAGGSTGMFLKRQAE